MYGGWTEYAVLWINFLGFIWDILNVSTTYILAQSQSSKSWIWVSTLLESSYFLIIK